MNTLVGVKITNIRITKVTLPQKLQTEMSQQTHLKAMMITMEKEHRRDLEKMVRLFLNVFSQSLTKINIKPTSLTHNPKLH